MPLLLIGFKPPKILLDLSSYLGSIVTPLALLYVGYLLYETGLKSMRMTRDMAIVLVMRYIVAPGIMLGLCRLFGFTGTGEGVFIIEAAMPVMTQSVVVSSSCGADEQYVAQGMSISTLACFVSIPLIMMVISTL